MGTDLGIVKMRLEFQARELIAATVLDQEAIQRLAKEAAETMLSEEAIRAVVTEEVRLAVRDIIRYHARSAAGEAMGKVRDRIDKVVAEVVKTELS